MTRKDDQLLDMLARATNLVVEDAEAFNTSRRMLRVCLDIWQMLHEKNQAYGNSALDPVRIFSRADRVEQIKVRIDDKLSRMSRGSAAGEDAIFDLMGYLILLRVAEEMDTEESFFEPDKFHERTVPTHPRLNPAAQPFEDVAARLDAEVQRLNTWTCGACGDKVELRTARCDCGAPKPAWSEG